MQMLSIDTVPNTIADAFHSQLLTLLLWVVMCGWALGDSESLPWSLQRLQRASAVREVERHGLESWFPDSFYVLYILEAITRWVNSGFSLFSRCGAGWSIILGGGRTCSVRQFKRQKSFSVCGKPSEREKEEGFSLTNPESKFSAGGLSTPSYHRYWLPANRMVLLHFRKQARTTWSKAAIYSPGANPSFSSECKLCFTLSAISDPVSAALPVADHRRRFKTHNPDNQI